MCSVSFSELFGRGSTRSVWEHTAERLQMRRTTRVCLNCVGACQGLRSTCCFANTIYQTLSQGGTVTSHTLSYHHKCNIAEAYAF